MTFEQFCAQLEEKIQNAYTNGVSLQEAELLASEFLGAMLKVSGELKKADLDSRMRKSAVKTIRARAYMHVASEGLKRPTEAALAATVEAMPEVGEVQQGFDIAEVETADLERYYNIFQNAHIHYRGISKGRFGD